MEHDCKQSTKIDNIRIVLSTEQFKVLQDEQQRLAERIDYVYRHLGLRG